MLYSPGGRLPAATNWGIIKGELVVVACVTCEGKITVLKGIDRDWEIDALAWARSGADDFHPRSSKYRLTLSIYRRRGGGTFRELCTQSITVPDSVIYPAQYKLLRILDAFVSNTPLPPIQVEKTYTRGKYQLVDGFHRLIASVVVGYPMIGAEILPGGE